MVFASSACKIGMLIVNRLPLPSSLSTSSRPPRSSAKLLVIAKPRPVPPYFFVTSELAWVNGSRILLS